MKFCYTIRSESKRGKHAIELLDIRPAIWHNETDVTISW